MVVSSRVSQATNYLASVGFVTLYNKKNSLEEVTSVPRLSYLVSSMSQILNRKSPGIQF